MKIKDGTPRNKLDEIYRQAAKKAFDDDIDPGNEEQLVSWIENNCSFQPEYLFFIIIGIGSELADLQAQHEGFDGQVDKIWKERIEPKFRFDRTINKWVKK